MTTIKFNSLVCILQILSFVWPYYVLCMFIMYSMYYYLEWLQDSLSTVCTYFVYRLLCIFLLYFVRFTAMCLNLVPIDETIYVTLKKITDSRTGGKKY